MSHGPWVESSLAFNSKADRPCKSRRRRRVSRPATRRARAAPCPGRGGTAGVGLSAFGKAGNSAATGNPSKGFVALGLGGSFAAGGAFVAGLAAGGASSRAWTPQAVFRLGLGRGLCLRIRLGQGTRLLWSRTRAVSRAVSLRTSGSAPSLAPSSWLSWFPPSKRPAPVEPARWRPVPSLLQAHPRRSSASRTFTVRSTCRGWRSRLGTQ